MQRFCAVPVVQYVGIASLIPVRTGEIGLVITPVKVVKNNKTEGGEFHDSTVLYSTLF